LVRGSVEVERYTPLALGRIAFELRGDISARLLQWQFARNLAEARGRFGLDLLKITGTFVQPIVEGTLTAHEVFLNLRRFHELSFSRGTIRFVRVGSGDDGRIIIGRGEGSPGGVTLAGLVDGDGKIELSGRVDHSGMGGFIQSAWHRALDRVDSGHQDGKRAAQLVGRLQRRDVVGTRLDPDRQSGRRQSAR
jgi:hypothetical protein